MNQVSKNRMELRVLFTRENPNEMFSDNIARYADWLETKLAHHTEQLRKHNVSGSLPPDEIPYCAKCDLPYFRCRCDEPARQ